MDQERIGRFIAELRHEKGLTQAQLAESLGVSGKAVSKWERGKGLPDISALLPLCEVLGITVNELLSAERLSHEEYGRMAEENIITLMQSGERSRRRSSSLALPAALGAAAVILLMVFPAGGSGGPGIFALLDAVSLLALAVPVVLAMWAAGLSRAAWRGIRMAAGAPGAQEDAAQSRLALGLLARLLLCCGALESLLQMVPVLAAPEHIFINLSVALLTSAYGLIGYLVLLPLRFRLAAERVERPAAEPPAAL